jgi:hypothetical protein
MLAALETAHCRTINHTGDVLPGSELISPCERFEEPFA